MIDHNLKCIFIHIPATGGSIIEKSLTGLDWQNFNSNMKHLDSELCQLYYPEWHDYYKFTIVRNPFDWLVSMYVKTKPKGIDDLSFENYIRLYGRFKYMSWEYPLNRIQIPFINAIRGVNYVGKFEFLEESFQDICKALNLKGTLLKERLHSNQGKRDKDYRKYYNKVTRPLVEEIFKEDLKIFGYEF